MPFSSNMAECLSLSHLIDFQLENDVSTYMAIGGKPFSLRPAADISIAAQYDTHRYSRMYCLFAAINLYALSMCHAMRSSTASMSY